MPLVTKWTGREVKALREAARMSLMEFADKLGVSDRIVSRWEGDGERATIRMVNQEALDTLLARAAQDAQGRFIGILALDDIPRQTVIESNDEQTSTGEYVKHPGDGKPMARIPEGIFLAGKDDEPVWVGEFHIDVFPTTNADYARFCAATRYTPPDHWSNGRCPRDLFDHPVVYVTWEDASAYAAWAGKCLPTSEQLEKAARGTTGRTFPWGDQRTAAKCNVRETGVERTTSVSRYHSGVSPYGVYDLVGNVWEWLATPTAPGRYELRGSAFPSPLFRGMPSVANAANHMMRDDDTGFRCVATPDQMTGTTCKVVNRTSSAEWALGFLHLR